MDENLKSPQFWLDTISEYRKSDIHNKWLAFGEETESLAFSHSSKKDRARGQNRSLNITGALGRATLGDVLYQEPVAVVRPKNSTIPTMVEIAAILETLLKHVFTQNENVHQSIGWNFSLWGLGCLKIIPEPSGLSFIPIRPEKFTFSTQWVENGGTIEKSCPVIIEAVDMTHAELHSARYFKSSARQALYEKLRGQCRDIPPELAYTTVYEINYRKADGGWRLVHVHPDYTLDVLQDADNTLGVLPYCFLAATGSRGLMPGLLSDIGLLDKSLNNVFSRSLQVGAESGVIAVYDKSLISEKDMKQTRFGVKLVGCSGAEADRMKNAVVIHKVGQVDERAARVLEIMRMWVQWITGILPEQLSGAVSNVTATETNFVSAFKAARSLPVARLVDQYFTQVMRKTAIALHYSFNVGWQSLHIDALPEAEFSTLSAMSSTLSDTLEEFEITAMPGSSRRSRHAEQVAALGMLTNSLPLWDKLMRTYHGERVDYRKLFLDFLRALELSDRPETLLVPVEEEVLPEQAGEEENAGQARNVPIQPENEGVGMGFSQPEYTGEA